MSRQAMSAEGQAATAHSAALDGLRGVAALVVVIAHAFGALFVLSHPGPVVALGAVARGAVIFFFVLSGFVIGGSIRASLERDRFSIVRFALNRATRIYPAFLLAVALAWMVALSRHHDVIRSVAPFVAEPMSIAPIALIRDLAFLFGSGTPMQNANAPVWSLRLEVVCYGVAGLLALAFTTRRLAARTACIALVLALAGLALYRLDSAILGFAAFGAGAFVSFVPLPRLGTALPLASGIAVLLMLGTMLQALTLADPAETVRTLSFHAFQIAAVIAAALAVVVAGRETGRLAAFARRLAPLAPFSYTLFITHVPLIVLLLGAFPLPESVGIRLVLAVGCTAAAVAFAMAAARIVEQHAVLREWLAARPPFAQVLRMEARR
jgi:peptidoglycan/LPS O-acetylase OafA/YrhL